MTVRIRSIGVAVPQHAIPQEHAVALVAPLSAKDTTSCKALQAVYKRSRIAKRHSVLLEEQEGEFTQSFYESPLNGEHGPTTGQRMDAYAQHAGALAAESAQNAVANDPELLKRVTHLVTASCSGFFAPGVECDLIAQLALSPTVRRVHIGFMGCHAALNALSVAKAFCEADKEACVLVTCIELCSLHLQYGWDRDRVLGNALFADGAASAIVENEANEQQHSRGPLCHTTEHENEGLQLLATGSIIIPSAAHAIRWRVGDHGFEMSLAQELPDIIEAHLREWLEGWLKDQGIALRDVQSWAVHPGGPRVLDAVQNALQITKEDLRDSWEVLTNYGNMSSPTILFILQRAMQRQAPLPCVALGFGPGLAIEAALFTN